MCIHFMDIYCVCIPGLEAALLAEVQEAGFSKPRMAHGGVSFEGEWTDVWRANYTLRGASRILARIGSFHAAHLAQLDKRSRAFAWGDTLLKQVPVHVEASCSRSRIYHSGAAADRVARAIHEELGAVISDAADVTVKVRIEDDLCTISIDTSGGLLHKRGHKQAMAKAPLRETMAALLLHQCGYNGQEPVFDPLCGSGTFVIEAAEIATHLPPGRNRSFAFEKLASFDAEQWQKLRAAQQVKETSLRFHGSDRDAGAVKAATSNAERAGVAGITSFSRAPVSEAQPPQGPPGLIIMNPPYGTRLGDKRDLRNLHAAIGSTLQQRFKGWRVGLLTSNGDLARATGLPFGPRSEPILHGGLRVHLYQTAALP